MRDLAAERALAKQMSAFAEATAAYADTGSLSSKQAPLGVSV